MAISTSATLPTPLNADVVAFCPESGLHHVLACGCYELDNTQQPARRHGRLALAFVDRAGRQLVETSAVEGIGVLDCSWLQTSRLLLSAATAACDTRIYQVHKGADGTATLAEEACATMPCADAGDACMALDWSADASRVAVTSTAGRVYLGELGQSSGGCSGLCGSASWRAHELEGWAVAFDPRDSNTLYTGADDAQLKRWDLRAAADGGEPVATATNRRSHGAGVCCVSPSRLREHCVATGSYDETARLWDVRQLRAPVSELGLGGGVWRLKWHPERADLLLAACMHAGFAVLSSGGAEAAAGGEGLSLVARYEAHGLGGALGYGADWAHGGALAAATCSFYDRALHAWTLEEV